MTLFTTADIQQLYFNGLPSEVEKDHFPVVRLYRPYSDEVWLFSKLDPNNMKVFFGLIQDRYKVTMGHTNYRDLITRKGSYADPIVRDADFTGKYPLSVYRSAAYELGKIITDDKVLKRHRKSPKLKP